MTCRRTSNCLVGTIFEHKLLKQESLLTQLCVKYARCCCQRRVAAFPRRWLLRWLLPMRHEMPRRMPWRWPNFEPLLTWRQRRQNRRTFSAFASQVQSCPAYGTATSTTTRFPIVHA